MKITIARGFSGKRLVRLLLIVLSVFVVLILVIGIQILYAVKQFGKDFGKGLATIFEQNAPEIIGMSVKVTNNYEKIYVSLCTSAPISNVYLSATMPRGQIVYSWQEDQPSQLNLWGKVVLSRQLEIWIIQAPRAPTFKNAIENIDVNESDRFYLTLSFIQATIPNSEQIVITSHRAENLNDYEVTDPFGCKSFSVKYLKS
jgi:hypothetical protein